MIGGPAGGFFAFIDESPGGFDEGVDALLGAAGDEHDVFAFFEFETNGEALEELVLFLLGKEIDFVEGDEFALLGEGGGVLEEFAADGFVLLDGIGTIDGGGIDDVNEGFGALDVAKKIVAETGTFGSAFDKAGDIGDDHAAVTGKFNDTKVGRKGGEGVIGDFGVAREMARRRVDFPALGFPMRPTSAMSLSSRRRVRSTQASPWVNWRGVWLTDDLKCSLPRPPRPPGAATQVISGFERSMSSSSVS